MTDSRSGFGSLHMPRSRGAVSGLLLLILGAWGALIPFVGPYFHFAYTPDQAWAWSTARAWLEVFPGVAAAAGRISAADLPETAPPRCSAAGSPSSPAPGSSSAARWRRRCASATSASPIAATDAKRAVIEIAYFSGLGALIVFLGGAVLARVTIRTARDVELAHQAELAQSTDAFDGFDTPVAQTEVLSAEPRRHRRESKGGVFRRAPSH